MSQAQELGHGVRLRRLTRPFAATLTRRWDARSRLFLVGEGARWSVDHDLEELAAVADRLAVRVAPRRLLSASQGQAAFYGSQFTLLREPWSLSPHALATAYFHGRPGTPGMPEFDEAYRVLGAHHEELDRVQVTHTEMRELVLSSGIDSAKVFTIRIGVDESLFSPQMPESRAQARAKLDLPQSAFVIGSFHKDGVGWAEGLEPKAIKGPDVLLETFALLRERIPELHVLLSAPARGYVRAGLERLGIPYVHRQLDDYREIAVLYRALDAYVVPSRQEGGPKGVLEAMASGVPVVSTRVGQAAELIEDGVNGWLADVDDAEVLAERLASIGDASSVVAAGLETARANSYAAQLPEWRAFFDGFVAHA
jgi:glycosyltransferase involved in cell wall biosynthesis